MKKLMLSLVLFSAIQLGATDLITYFPYQPISSSVEHHMCDRWVHLEYVDSGVAIACRTEDNPHGDMLSFKVESSDYPNPAEVIGLIQPYIMTIKSLQVAPWPAGYSQHPIESFNLRVILSVKNNKIIRIHFRPVD